jgi:hypothetical protein
MGEAAPVSFTVRYDGRDASEHQLDMRLLGRSLIGLERVVGDAVFIAAEGRMPTTRERKEISIVVAPPHAACVEIEGQVRAAAGVLPFVLEAIRNPGTKFVFQFLSFVLKQLGGKPKEANVHLMEAHKLLLEDRQQERADRDLERQTALLSSAQWQNTMLALVDRLAPSARDIVAPVGPSADTLRISGPPGHPPTEIDAPMADAIRSSERLEVGEMERFRVKVDGVVLHSRVLKIEHPERPGKYFNADVRDPAFDEQPNAYTSAIGDELVVDAKPSRRANGELVSLHVMNVASS